MKVNLRKLEFLVYPILETAWCYGH